MIISKKYKHFVKFNIQKVCVVPTTENKQKTKQTTRDGQLSNASPWLVFGLK